ncbi:MAG: acetyl-CoA carboxylase biotin carboxyl carrier protein [Ignavibacteriales bacterium]|nr:acetyl-CoA carboxylase biotin carboxyl carrier protein [Ignavibacteriales bacterium]
MDLDLIKKLVKIVDTSGVTELEVQEGELKIKIVKNSQSNVVYSQPAISSPQHLAAIPQIKSEQEIKAPVEKVQASNLYEVRSPIVGTLYRAPAPDADPYVQVGDTISKGTILCIVEAMKLMNEIESEVDGKIMKILVDNGKPVEYNQPLFLIERN